MPPVQGRSPPPAVEEAARAEVSRGVGGQGTPPPGFVGGAQGGGDFEYAATLKIKGGIIASPSMIEYGLAF